MDRNYPPTAFYFKVQFTGVNGITDNPDEQCFQEVSGLSFELETEELREGGENRFVHKLPRRVKYPNLVLKRGLLPGLNVNGWMKSAMTTFFTVPVLHDFQPADLVITLLDETGGDIAAWNVVQAYPVKWAAADFKATDNAVAVETIELAYQYFERIK